MAAAADFEDPAVHVIADLCLGPWGWMCRFSRTWPACQRVLAESGLVTHLHAYGTNIEGPWETVFAAIKRCHEVVHQMGAPRITTTLKIGTRTDRDQTMDQKVRSVQEKLADANGA